MPKSKGRKHPEKKKMSGAATAVKSEMTGTAEVTPVTVSPVVTETKRVERYPYLGKELLRIGIVTAITLLVLIVFALVLR